MNYALASGGATITSTGGAGAQNLINGDRHYGHGNWNGSAGNQLTITLAQPTAINRVDLFSITESNPSSTLR